MDSHITKKKSSKTEKTQTSKLHTDQPVRQSKISTESSGNQREKSKSPKSKAEVIVEKQQEEDYKDDFDDIGDLDTLKQSKARVSDIQKAKEQVSDKTDSVKVE